MTNEEILKQAAELLPKVTQGEWKAFVNKSGTTSVYSVQFESPNKPSVLVAKNCQGNSRFIALSPQLARIALEQAEQIEALRELIYEAYGNAESVISNMEEQSRNHGGIGFCTKDEEMWLKKAKQALAATAEKE